MFILLGVALFATLAFVISRSMRSETTTTMSQREVTLAAAEILDYSQQLSRAISRLRRKNVSENDISFDNNFEAGYNHTPAQPDTNKIFHPSGGNISYKTPLDQWLDSNQSAENLYGILYFTARHRAKGVLSDTSPEGLDLLLIIPYLQRNLCIAINDKLGVPNPSGAPPVEEDPNCIAEGGKFKGVYSGGCDIGKDTNNANTACTSYDGRYYFFHVLIGR